MTLTRLSAADAAALAGHMAGGKPLSPEVAETVVARADGVPLFVEELTRTVLASDFLSEEDGAWRLAGPMPPLAVPVSLQDTLMAKLDRLGAYKDIAQTGAALGRSFRHDVLAAVGGHDPAALATGLEALVAEDLVLRRGLPPDATCVFRQSIVQEVAYQSLLRSRRQALHRRIAEVLERDFPAIADSDPAELARHLTAAGLEGRALAHTRRAAAIDRSAMAEALSHADAALAALARLRETPENRLLEIDLLSMRALALSATLGFFDPAVETALLRARAAARELKRPDIEARVLVSLYAHNTSRDRLGEARRIGAELRRLSERLDNDQLRFAACLSAGIDASETGDVAAAHNHLERALAVLDAMDAPVEGWMAAQDPGVVAWTLLARSRFMLGFPEQAVAAQRAGLARAEAIGHPMSGAFALSVSAARSMPRCATGRRWRRSAPARRRWRRRKAFRHGESVPRSIMASRWRSSGGCAKGSRRPNAESPSATACGGAGRAPSSWWRSPNSISPPGATATRSTRWRRGWNASPRSAAARSRPNCTACAARSCSTGWRRPNRRRPPNWRTRRWRRSTAPSPSRARAAPWDGNCARRWRKPIFSRSAAAAPRLAPCCARSATASPKAPAPPIRKPPKPGWSPRPSAPSDPRSRGGAATPSLPQTDMAATVQTG